LPDPQGSHTRNTRYEGARFVAAPEGATAPAIPLLEQELAKAKSAQVGDGAEPMPSVITADDPANLPMGYNDLVLVHGLERRGDLNNRLAKAHGRNKQGKDRQTCEGITMLLGSEEVWCRRANLVLVAHPDVLNRVCDERGVADKERTDGLLFLGVEQNCVANLPGGGGGLYKVS